ncbi:MAG TPA: exodeoxyribonuclease VII small subunit [Candidatus Butyricicoccus stercorigallinarum]|nr:exodeoxyribonuclease VII small subunit [Candidatus Butyricicoccus stercorigallinarum]
MEKLTDLTFEQAMKRLEDIVSQLEAGEAPLDKSMALFEEGTKLSAHLSSLLDRAEQKVTMMTTQNGEQIELPFDMQEGE